MNPVRAAIMVWVVLGAMAGARAQEPATPPSTAPAQEVPPRGEAPLQDDAPALDLNEVDTSVVHPFQFHGRVDLTAAVVEEGGGVDDFREFDIFPLSPALLFSYRFLTILKADVEVEWEGLEEEIEVDRAVLEAEIFDEKLEIKVGRDVVPFGIERFRYSPSMNALVDRPAAFRKVFPGTFPDYGVFTSSRWTHPDGWGVSAETSLSFGLQSGYDAEAVPEPPEDHNSNKQFTGRLGFRPLESLEVGASYLYCEYDRLSTLAVDFAGFDVSYKFYELEARAEWIGGDVERAPADGGTFHRKGWYLQLERRWPLPFRFPQALRTVIRYDSIDANNHEQDALDLRRYAFGLNFELMPRLILKIEHEINDERHDEIANDAYFCQIVFSW